MSGVQFHVLTHLSRILSSVPEGRETAVLVNAELKESGGRIDWVPRPLIDALRESLPVLERAMASTDNQEALESFQRLQRIALMRQSSQTIPAVLDVSKLDRARDMARPRVESPAFRYLERMIRSEGASGRPTRVFRLQGRIVHRGGWAGLLALLSDHFGSEVTEESLQRLLALPQTEFRVGAVSIRRDERERLRMAGEIRGVENNERAGFFDMSVPPVPPRGHPWAVKVEAISLVQRRLGIGSQLLARVAHFLHDRGVHTMNADAMEDAGLFCIFNGFRVGKSLYEDIVSDFVEEMRGRGVTLPEGLIQTRLLGRDANLAELAAFEWEGERAGRNFLRTLFERKYLPVAFELSADKQSWLRLLSNLHRIDPAARIAPLEWGGLRPETRQMLFSGVSFVGGNVPELMSSDRDHAVHLIERLNNWAQPLAMFVDFPESMIERTPDEMRDDISRKRETIGDLLNMLDADRSSPLFSHFHDLMDPRRGDAYGDFSSGRAYFIARTLLRADQKNLLSLPPALKALFQEILSVE